MIKSKIIFILGLLIAISLSAQQELPADSINFIKTFDGRMFFSNSSIYAIKGAFKKKHFEINSTKVDYSEVEFLQTKKTLYANTFQLNGLNHYAECIERGKINCYGYDYYGTYSTVHTEYLNKGLEPLMRSNVKNIKSLVADNPKALKHIKFYEGYRNVAIGFVVAGVGGLIYGLSDWDNMDTGMGIAISCLGIQYIMTLCRPRKLKAIKIYNEGEREKEKERIPPPLNSY